MLNFIIKPMTTIFYLFTLIFIGYELLVLFKPYKFKDLAAPFKEYVQTKEITYDFITAIWLFVIQTFYMFWCIIGLFSVNSKYFLILLSIGLLTSVLKKLFSKVDLMIIGWDAFCSITILCVIFINHFA